MTSGAEAGVLTTSGTFVTTGQSIWDSGAAFSKDYTTGVSTGFNAHPSIGGVGCGWFGDCWGAEAALHLAGSIGINVGAHVDGGSVNATLPFDATLAFPGTVAAGGSFTPSVTVAMGPGSFSTTAPNVGAFADIYGSIYAGASARICVWDCWGDAGTIVNSSFNAELAAFNRGNDGELRILGGTVGLSGSVGPTEWDFTLPRGATGAGAAVLTGSVSTDVVHGGLDVAGLVASALGVPISGSLGPIDWMLLSASATIDTYLNQAFRLTPEVVVNLHVVETGQDVYCTASGGCGTVSALAGSHYLTIQPFFAVNATFRNDTGLVFAPGYDFSLLSAGIDGIGSIGPAYQTARNFPLPMVSLYASTFDLGGWNVVAGDPFTVEVLDGPEPVPEPASLALLGSGLVALAVRRRRKGGGRGQAAPPRE